MILFENRASVILFNVLKQMPLGSKFLLPSNICPIVPSVFLKAKVDFEFLDICIKTLCMDPQKVIQTLETDSSITGVLFVHTFGIDLEVESFFKSIKMLKGDTFIIDDRCLMIPDFDLNIEKSYADMALFSTGYSKYIDINWGGFAFLKDKYMYVKSDLVFKEEDLEEFTQDTQRCINDKSLFEYKDTCWLGSNTILYNDFEVYKKEIEKRTLLMKQQKEKLNKIYENNLPKSIHLGKEFSSWRFSILVENKELLLKKIFQEKLFASSHYKEVDYMFKKEYSKESNAKDIHNKIINLFNDFRFNEDKAQKIVNIINKFLKG